MSRIYLAVENRVRACVEAGLIFSALENEYDVSVIDFTGIKLYNDPLPIIDSESQAGGFVGANGFVSLTQYIEDIGPYGYKGQNYAIEIKSFEEISLPMSYFGHLKSGCEYVFEPLEEIPEDIIECDFEYNWRKVEDVLIMSITKEACERIINGHQQYVFINELPLLLKKG